MTARDIVSEYHQPKLPKWIRPDQGEEVTGKLLYVEEWAYNHHFKKVDEASPDLSTLIFLLLILVIFTPFIYMDICFVLFFTIFVLFPLILGILILRDHQLHYGSIYQMPFCIYENGFTSIHVGIIDVIAGKQRFILWSEVNSLTIKYSRGTIALSFNEKGFQRLDEGNLTDPYFVIELFQKFIPHLMNDQLMKLLNPSNGRHSKFNYSKEYDNTVLNVGMLIVFVIGFSIASFIYIVIQSSAPALIFTLLIFLITYHFFFKMTFDPVKSTKLQDMCRQTAEISNDGVYFSIPRSQKILRSIFEPIPWAQIKWIRLKLSPKYEYEGCIELVSGDSFRVPYGVYQAMKDMPQFRQFGFHYYNVDHIGHGPPFVSRNWAGWGLLHFLNIGLPFVGLVLLTYFFS